MIISEEAHDYLMHYGVLRRSGRYPWGSGGPEYASSESFLGYVDSLKKQGMSEAEIAKGMDTTVKHLRAARTIALNEERGAKYSQYVRLKDSGMSASAIAREMDINESTLRGIVKAAESDKINQLESISGALKQKVDEGAYIDIGSGVEAQLGIAGTKLSAAVALLEEQGYVVKNVQVDQISGDGKTTVKVLAPPNTEYRDIVMNKERIQQFQAFSDDGGRTINTVQPPMSISSKRVGVVWNEDGGGDADGVIYVRRGVEDVSMGATPYAQVRIAVDGTHYLKGMAIYKDDMPDGVDLLFNTNKDRSSNKLDAMKAIKDDPESPFGAVVRQRLGADGKPISAINIVGSKEGSGEEGSWDAWSRNLPSQFLSKQSPKLAQQQLDVTFERKKKEFDEIMALTNPAVKKALLESFADGADSSAVHLKAAAMPRQSTHVILPMKSLKETEVYAPNFKPGERVALVRFPHGGTFEIAELTVNNNHRESKKLLGRAQDAIAINPKTAAKLSGADFDGDTVLVIPNNSGAIKSKGALAGLKGFDPQRAYPAYDGMKTMDGGTYNAKTGKTEFDEGKKPSSRTKGIEMGKISNLITDMTIRGASDDELARAVRHSMVVIDAEKHRLNYRESGRVNGIAALSKRYQPRDDGRTGGASTLISRATSEKQVAKRKLAPARDGIGPIDPETGRLRYVETGESYTNRKGKTIVKTQGVERLALTDDAFTLSSGTRMETIYANHSNRLKDLANTARKETLGVKTIPYSPSAKKAYAPEVQSLNAKLNLALRNRPLERQAQLLANAQVARKRAANPNMDKDTEKKIKMQALTESRLRTGAARYTIDITPSEWNAIQAGAITNAKLTDILKKADLDQVKALATPRTPKLMTPTKVSRAKSMADLGYPQSEIAAALGVSLTTLKTELNE